MTRRDPNFVDVHVGSRIRMRRQLIGMSQEKLGELLGITFQQVQKYEKGANRISASRLYFTAKILGVPVQFFFEELPGIEEHGGMGLSNLRLRFSYLPERISRRSSWGVSKGSSVSIQNLLRKFRPCASEA